MSDELIKDENNRWQKGTRSPNPNGRPRGAKAKALTDKQIQEYLGKRSEHYIKELEAIAENSEDLKLKFKVYNGLVSFDFQMRASEYKKWLDKENLKLKKKAIEAKGVNEDDESEEDDHSAPIFSLKSVK